MSEFGNFKDIVNAHMREMVSGTPDLFTVAVGGDEMWDAYIRSFPSGSNPVYRERTEHDCSTCRSFIRRCGGLVRIVDNQLVSVWDVEGAEYPYNIVAEKLSAFVKSKAVRDLFLTEEKRAGLECNYELIDGKSRKWEHFYFDFPAEYVVRGPDMNARIARARDNRAVYGRSLRELTIDAAQTILDLIDQGSLYRGAEHLSNVVDFIAEKKAFDDVPESDRDNWLWSFAQLSSVARVRNSALGTLLIDLSNDVDLDVAVTKFERVMAPDNYKRPKALITQKMVESAEKKIAELGLEESLGRRHATVEDLSVNDVIFVDRGTGKRMKDSILADLKKNVPVNRKNLSKVEDVDIEHFIANILPNADTVEVIVESRHKGNLVSLVAPKNPDAPPILKWGNNFSWAYSGEVADSMKQRVKAAGGNVDGVLRFSIQWNDEHGDNLSDLDAHCIEPNGNEIYFSNRRSPFTGGELDVDIQYPEKVAVENITWQSVGNMLNGEYKFYVHNYTARSGSKGFSAEVEFDGQTFSFEYGKRLRQGEKIHVANVHKKADGSFELIRVLDASESTESREVWGIHTNQWAKVSTIMRSPNHWESGIGTGNKHTFMILDGCKSDEPTRGFFNEFLRGDLTEHRRVFEALGARTRVDESESQTAGVGFSETQKNSILARVTGTFNRVVKINF